jgi:DNA polymerase IIIc chi subunit
MSTCVFHDTEQAQQDRRLFEIVEAAHKRRERVLIFARTEERASVIDRFLWVLKQEAFIPHKVIAGLESDCAVPVGIVTTEINPTGASVLIADGHCSLEFAAGFEFIHEFVDRSSPDRHEACRSRFRAYRARQIPVAYSK